MADAAGLRKKVSLFLKSEKGGISRKALVDGAVAAGLVFALSYGISAAHANDSHIIHSNSVDVSVNATTKQAIGTHSNHSSHSNY